MVQKWIKNLINYFSKLIKKITDFLNGEFKQ